ncbi:MAG: glycosyltransferase [Cytophagaceae bacterium]|jgi:glycosyltransferase involved in cell wall biosynthesis|nr:glycosyltransferase [Cytophagaceae bacterium]
MQARTYKILNTVTTDLVTDQRVHKISSTLTELGFDVHVIGRKKKDSLPLVKQTYSTYRFSLLFEKGPFFYIQYSIHLFFYLLFHRSDIIIANDLDTLLPCYLVSKLKGSILVYDNHEYFTGVPELIERPRIQKIWKTIEKNIFHKVTFVYTDNFAKKGLFEKEYQHPVDVVMNVPYWDYFQDVPLEFVQESFKNKFVLLYQGTGINIKRGTEELTEAMRYLDERFLLVFIGSGDVIERLKQLVDTYQLNRKVLFIPKVPFQELKYYTRQASLGITIDKAISENYIYSMPNKLFDYIHAGIPVLASHLPEVDRMVHHYQVGTFIEKHDPKHIAEQIQWIFDHPDVYQQWKANTLNASREVNWSTQAKVLENIYLKIKKELK